jgi:hypothetical protein
MIRDPSDGSVRINPPGESPLSRSEQSVCEAEGAKIDSGLAPDHSNNIERLRKSREWLSKYHDDKRASAVSPELDKAIQDELDHPPKSIMKGE